MISFKQITYIRTITISWNKTISNSFNQQIFLLHGKIENFSAFPITPHSESLHGRINTISYSKGMIHVEAGVQLVQAIRPCS